MSDSNPSTPERFPDLYSLLGLKPLERDTVVIEQALRRLAIHIQAGANATVSDSNALENSSSSASNSCSIPNESNATINSGKPSTAKLSLNPTLSKRRNQGSRPLRRSSRQRVL